MKTINLNGAWKIRWCDGQRGGLPHYIHDDGENHTSDVRGNSKNISDDYDDVKWLDATVPSEIHLDLMKLGILDDIYKGSNILKARWVEEFLWSYRKVFDAEMATNAGNCFLVFDCLYLGAVIYLNGEEIGRHSNSFYPCRINVTSKLKEKGNVLVVRLESGLYSVSEKPIKDYYTATMSMDVLLHKRMWLRIPQSSTMWDWSPRCLNIGICGNVHLDYSNEIVINQCSIRSVTDESLQSAEMEARIFTNGSTAPHLKMRMTVGGNSAITDIIPSCDQHSCKIKIANPTLWWPNLYGEQYLYEVKVEVLNGDLVLYEHTRKVGLRHVEVDQSNDNIGGKNFCFIINGVKVFAKGANFVPADMITASITRSRYEKLIDLAAEANFNLLRIWGGGLYESDDFYELCDQKGIMVWQEFICACGSLPISEDSFFFDIKKEFTENVRRLSGYASLVAWCGNNELDGGYQWQTHFMGGVIMPDYGLYHKTLPKILKQEDNEKYYQPSSPFSPDVEAAIDDDTQGDQHPWSVGFKNKDHREYRKMECRFPNEGGLLGPVSLPTMKACLDNENEALHSFSFAVHDNTLENFNKGTSPDLDVKFWLDLDARSMTLDRYAFCGGLVQGEGLTDYILNFRRRKHNTTAAVFWMYNDCWPCTRSWTIVDYYLNVTPSYYYVKRAFARYATVLVEENGYTNIYCMNDTLDDRKFTLEYGSFTVDGSFATSEQKTVTLSKNSSTIHAATNHSTSSHGADAREVNFHETKKHEKLIHFALLRDEQGLVVSSHRLLEDKYFELGLKESSVTVTLEGGYATFKADAFVMGVCLDLNGEDVLPDNMFDLYPGIEYKILWGNKNPPHILFTLNEQFML